MIEQIWSNIVTYRYLTVLLVLSGGFPAFCQQILFNTSNVDFKFERLHTKDGLSHNTVNAIVQDNAGFLWLGTDEGLNRYDGYTFRTYKNDPDDPNSLSSNTVWSLCVDDDGLIWIATEGGGACRLNPETEVFQRFQNNKNDSTSLSSNTVQTLYKDRFGVIWLGTWGEGLNRFRSESEQFERIFLPNKGVANAEGVTNKIWTLQEDSRGYLWIGTDGGGVLRTRLNAEHGQIADFQQFVFDSADASSISNNSVKAICKNGNGELWLGTYYNGLNKFDYETETFERFFHDSADDGSISENSIWRLYTDSKGLLWIGTFAGGLNVWDGRGKFSKVRHNPGDLESISNDDIRSLYEDRSGVLWVGTMTGGVNKIDRKPAKFGYTKKIPNEVNSLSSDFIFALCEDRKGNLWIGSYGEGVSRYDPVTNHFEHYRHDPEDTSSISSNVVRVILQDSKENIWFGTYGGGVDRYDPSSNCFQRFGHLLDEPAQYVRALFEDKNGTVWVGTNGGGLKHWDNGQGAFTPHSLGDNVNSAYVLSISQNQPNTLWVGTYGAGLIKLDLQTGKSTSYIHVPDDRSSLSHLVVPEIHFSQMGEMWVGTFGGGLNLYDERSDSFHNFREKDGLGGNIIAGILEDFDGNFWIGTNKGITRFDPVKKTFRNFDETDGLQPGEMNPGAYCKGRNGIFYFGGVAGLNYFVPTEVADNQLLAPIVVTSFKVFGHERPLGQPLAEDSVIEIAHSDKFFSFEFASLDFTKPSKNKYLYKMQGFDEEWIDPGTRRFASYTNLDPGAYRFRVKGTNSDGVWNEAGVSVALKVIPPFWLTWWFRGLLGITALLLVAGITQRRVAVLRKEKQAQEAFSQRLIEVQETERKRIASELHDSLGQDLLVIKNAIQQHINRKAADDAETGELQEIAATAGEAIEEVREISRNLHPHMLDRLGLTKAIEAMATRLTEASGIQIDIELGEIDNILAADKEINLYRIVQESLSNILKHARANKARVSLTVSDNRLQVEIQDDGVGFDVESMEQTRSRTAGFGLLGITERVKIFAGELSIDSKIGKGTLLQIKIPLNRRE